MLGDAFGCSREVGLGVRRQVETDEGVTRDRLVVLSGALGAGSRLAPGPLLAASGRGLDPGGVVDHLVVAGRVEPRQGARVERRE
ncbi:hypothetical protein [Intrasporangium flavum]|uniref:hypothetical protein n=1 Tax=Intrasporangium flavum TaxID=1428657 RepID=UPI001F61F48A|nr:hypothetical protein [Intrasporangium flavum]